MCFTLNTENCNINAVFCKKMVPVCSDTICILFNRDITDPFLL